MCLLAMAGPAARTAAAAAAQGRVCMYVRGWCESLSVDQVVAGVIVRRESLQSEMQDGLDGWGGWMRWMRCERDFRR